MPEFRTYVWLTPDDATLVARVRALGLRRVSRETGVSPPMICRWLRGQHGIALEKFERIKQAAGGGGYPPPNERMTMIKRQELTDPTSCLNKAKDDELLFVLLGRDEAAPKAVLAWIDERIALGKNTRDDPQIREAYQWVARVIGLEPPPAPK